MPERLSEDLPSRWPWSWTPAGGCAPQTQTWVEQFGGIRAARRTAFAPIESRADVDPPSPRGRVEELPPGGTGDSDPLDRARCHQPHVAPRPSLLAAQRAPLRRASGGSTSVRRRAGLERHRSGAGAGAFARDPRTSSATIPDLRVTPGVPRCATARAALLPRRSHAGEHRVRRSPDWNSPARSTRPATATHRPGDVDGSLRARGCRMNGPPLGHRALARSETPRPHVLGFLATPALACSHYPSRRRALLGTVVALTAPRNAGASVAVRVLSQSEEK